MSVTCTGTRVTSSALVASNGTICLQSNTTVDVAIDVVQSCFRTFGARAIYDGAPLQRRLRDIMTLSQHATLNDSAWTRAGAALFGATEQPPRS